MSSEINGDGKGVHLNTRAVNSPKDRAAAFRVICRHTKTREEEDQVLWLLGLHYKPDPR